MKTRNYQNENERRRARNKDLRAKYKAEKHSGQRTNRRLGFLYDILKAAGLNWKQLAERSGIITPQSLNWWCVKDDAHLKIIQDVLLAVGLMLKPHFKGFNTTTMLPSAQRKQYHYAISGSLFDAKTEWPKESRAPLSELVEIVSNEPNRRLNFLARYIKQRLENAETLTMIVDELDTTQYSLGQYFINDDILLSKIYNLAERNGLTIVWQVDIVGK